MILWSTAGEGVGLFVAANVVMNLGHPEMLLPAMALVVGLHFLPMAYGVPFAPFYVLGLLLVAAGAIGLLLDQAGGTIAGFLAAAALTISAILAVRRDRRARRATAV